MFGADARYFNPHRATKEGMQPWDMTFGLGAHSCLGRNLVTGIRNRGDDKYGAHGRAVRIMKALYPPQRAHDTLHDHFESLPMILRLA